jgi:hypothetical protein
MTNPLKDMVVAPKSPTDPQECCDWANARLHPKAAEQNLRWVVTGNPAKPIELRRYAGRESMARPRDPNSRRSKAEKRKAKKAALILGTRSDPNSRVMERRERFNFLRSAADGRQGSIDQDICDGIGQMQALGLLDGHGHDPLDLRNVGREYAELYWERYEATAPSTGQFERRSRGTGEPPPRNGRYDRYDRLDDSMPRVGMERTAIHMLLTQHYHSDGLEGWVQRLINRELAKRGVPDVLVFLDSPTEGHDRYMLGCAVRGLCQLMDALGSLPIANEMHSRVASAANLIPKRAAGTR